MTRFALARLSVGALLAVGIVAAAAEPQPAADPEAAARQYRIARRLAAEGSPDASAALAKVFDLDPGGALADDALVDQALLLPIAVWPEGLGRIAEREAKSAATLLDRAIDGFPRGDRTAEARLLRSLLRLEPIPGRDTAKARLDLLSVASDPADERWRVAARYGVAWIDERSGARERARAAYQRLAIDHSASAAGPRALTGLARLLLRDGKFGRAAGLLQAAVQPGTEAGRDVPALRDLAVRAALRDARSGGRWADGTVVTSNSGLRGVATAVRLSDGGLLLADRRDGVVLETGTPGAAAGRWTLQDVLALAEDPMGRRFAATGERLYRLLPSGAVPIASLAPFAPPSALSADGWGRLFVLDRRGEKIGVVEPGAPAPAAYAEVGRGGRRLAGLAWDGARLVGLDAKGKMLVEVLADGSVREWVSIPCEKPEALAANSAGEVAVLDSKSGEVVLVGSDGAVRDRLSFKRAGVERAESVLLGTDGSLDLLAEGSGATVRFP